MLEVREHRHQESFADSTRATSEAPLEKKKRKKRKKEKNQLLICRLSSELSTVGETGTYLVLGFGLENGAPALLCGHGVLTKDRR